MFQKERKKCSNETKKFLQNRKKAIMYIRPRGLKKKKKISFTFSNGIIITSLSLLN